MLRKRNQSSPDETHSYHRRRHTKPHRLDAVYLGQLVGSDRRLAGFRTEPSWLSHTLGQPRGTQPVLIRRREKRVLHHIRSFTENEELGSPAPWWNHYSCGCRWRLSDPTIRTRSKSAVGTRSVANHTHSRPKNTGFNPWLVTTHHHRLVQSSSP